MDTNRLQELKAKKWKNLTKEERVEYQKLKSEGLPHSPVTQPALTPQPVMPVSELPKAEELKLVYDTKKYKELDPPIVEYLERTWGNWLNYFEIGSEYKPDFGGRGIYIRIPEHFSTEWKRETVPVYDNQTRRHKVDQFGSVVRKPVVTPDVRSCSLQVPLPDVKKWLDKVKTHLLDKAFAAGIRLPSMKLSVELKDQTREEYEKTLMYN